MKTIYLCFCLFLVACLLPTSFIYAQDKIVLRVSNWADEKEARLDQIVINEYMRLHPNVGVRFEPNPTSTYSEKILTAVAAGAPPDVFLLDAPMIPSFVNKGILLDLIPYTKQLNIDLNQFFPSVLDINMRHTPAGDSQLYAFPKDFTPLVMYYNKRLFREEGIPYPRDGWTWDDFLRLAQRFTKDLDGDGKPDQFGTAVLNHYYRWIVWIWLAGGDVVSPDGTRATGYFNSPETERALQFVADLRTKYKVVPLGEALREKSTTEEGLFYTGKIAMMPSGHWWLVKLRRYMDKGELDIGVAPFPRLPGGKKVTVMYESGWCVPAQTAHPKEAVELAAFLSGAYADSIRVGLGLAIAGVKSVAEWQVRADTFGVEQVFVDEVPYCRMPWGTKIERFSEVERLTEDAMGEVMYGGKEIHSVFTEYAERIDKQLENIRANLTYKFEPLKGSTEILGFLFGVAGVSILIALSGFIITRRKQRIELIKGYSFLSLSFFHLIVFVFTPLVFAFYLAFHRWDIIVPQKPFVGLDNFIEMVGDRFFWNALKNTLLYSVNVPIGMAISLLVAVMMNQKLRGVNLLRTLYFLPSVSSFVAIALVWEWLYHPQFGLANFLLGIFGIPPQPWLSSPQTALMSVMMMSIWMGIGYQMVIFLAGLQGIPDTLYEAAVIDGANPWQRFWRITLPLLKPTTFFVLVTSLIGSFQVFTSIYVLTSGGPMRSTDVVVYHIYQSAWENLRMGYAAAMSWLLFVIILIATWIQFKLIGRGVDYG